MGALPPTDAAASLAGTEPVAAEYPEPPAGGTLSCPEAGLGCLWLSDVGRLMQCENAFYTRAHLRLFEARAAADPSRAVSRGFIRAAQNGIDRWSSRLCLAVAAEPEYPPWLEPYR